MKYYILIVILLCVHPSISGVVLNDADGDDGIMMSLSQDDVRVEIKQLEARLTYLRGLLVDDSQRRASVHVAVHDVDVHGSDNDTYLALMDLYNSTNGDGWTIRDGWGDVNVSYCTWYGVVCDDGGDVIEISLVMNDLTKTLPSRYFGRLTKLKVIDFGCNSFACNESAGLPASWSTLQSLEELKLGSNKGLCGPIPEEYDSLTNLRIFDAIFCHFSGKLPQWPHLVNLTLIDLTGNAMSGTLNHA